MRRALQALITISLLIPLAAPAGVRAQPASPLCGMTLGPADLPPEMQSESGAPDLNLSDDPTICERSFIAAYLGEAGLKSVRSLALMSPSDRQAAADWSDYRKLLIANGWQELGSQPVADEAVVFYGSDARADVFTVQHLLRRGNVVAIVEASGPAIAHSPEIVLGLVYAVDGRIAASRSAHGGSARVGSFWPAVSVPTIVADANLTGAPLVGQSVQLGGLSGLVSVDAFGTEFVAVTDRGPTAEFQQSRGLAMVMPLPAYTPSIVRLRLDGNQLKVTERIGLRLQPGYVNPRTGSPFATGLPNSAADAAAFDQTGRNPWGTDPNGLDPEGIAVDPRDGTYWVVEEYGPSILHVDPHGTILARLVPAGASVDAPGQNVRPVLPPELAYHKPMRGLEGVAISPDGSRLFAIMQSPLAYPSADVANTSRNVRLLALDLTGPEPAVYGTYVYQTEPASLAGAYTQDHVQVSDIAALSADKLVVVEHDNLEGGLYKRVYRVDLEPASNVLGWGFGGTLEQIADLEAFGITPVGKVAILDLAQLGWHHDAVEGLTVIDESTLAVVSDNNFGFGGFDRAGRLLSNGAATRLSIVHLPGPIR